MRTQESKLESEGQDGFLNEDNMSRVYMYVQINKKTNNPAGKMGKGQDWKCTKKQIPGKNKSQKDTLNY